MDRLLTKEERDAVYDALPTDATCGDERMAFCKAQDAKTCQATLKAVGEWLSKLYGMPNGELAYARQIMQKDLDTFLRGEMPVERREP